MAVKYIRKTKPASKTEPRYCVACAGSGYYDDHGSPKCEACGGSGLEKTPVRINARRF